MLALLGSASTSQTIVPANSPLSAVQPMVHSVTFAEFSNLVADVAAWARSKQFRVPGIQSPPRVPGADRVLRRFQGEVRTIAVTVRGRRRSDVIADVVQGILVANGVSRDEWPEFVADALAATSSGSVGPSWASAA
jgi:hypothetical protein